MFVFLVQVNLRDGTHLPCDRLREATKSMKNLNRLAEKRLSVQEREREEFIQQAVNAHNRGHPLRKDGLYTRYFWRPLHQHTVKEMEKLTAAKAEAAEAEAEPEAADADAEVAVAAADIEAAGADAPPERIPTVIKEAHQQA